MVSESLHRLPLVRDSPAVRVYGSLFVLLFASQVLEFLFVTGVDFLSQLVPDALDAQLVGAVVYAALGMVALATAYWVIQARRPPRARLERHEVAQIGGLTAMLLLVAAYLLHGAADVPVFPGDVLTAVLTGGVAMGVLAFAYARACAFDVRLDLPGREAVRIGCVAAVIGAISGIAQFAVSTAPGYPLLSSEFVGQFAPQLSAGMLAWRVVVPGVCVGVGMGLLYNGAVQERLRLTVGPAGAIAGVTSLAGILGWAFVASGLARSPVPVVGALAAVVFLSLLGAFVAARAVHPVARRFDAERRSVAAASVGVGVVAVPLAGLAVIDPSAGGMVAGGVVLTVVAAVASVAYERSDSVWPSMLAFASYLVVGNTDLLLSLVRYVG